MIRRLAAILSALALFTSQASAGFLINSFSVRPLPTYSSLGCTNLGSGADPSTFTSVNVGTADASRTTILSITADDGTTIDFSFIGVTIGGDSATEIVDTANVNSRQQSAIYAMANPAGTSENIVIDFSEAVADVTLCVYAAYNLNSSTAIASNSGFDTSGGLLTLSVNTQDKGIAVGICGADSGSAAVTWVGLTEETDATGTGHFYSSAWLSNTSAATPLTVSCDYAGTGDIAGAAASFR